MTHLSVREQRLLDELWSSSVMDSALGPLSVVLIKYTSGGIDVISIEVGKGVVRAFQRPVGTADWTEITTQPVPVTNLNVQWP